MNCPSTVCYKYDIEIAFVPSRIQLQTQTIFPDACFQGINREIQDPGVAVADTLSE